MIFSQFEDFHGFSILDFLYWTISEAMYAIAYVNYFTIAHVWYCNSICLVLALKNLQL